MNNGAEVPIPIKQINKNRDQAMIFLGKRVAGEIHCTQFAHVHIDRQFPIGYDPSSLFAF